MKALDSLFEFAPGEVSNSYKITLGDVLRIYLHYDTVVGFVYAGKAVKRNGYTRTTTRFLNHHGFKTATGVDGDEFSLRFLDAFESAYSSLDFGELRGRLQSALPAVAPAPVLAPSRPQRPERRSRSTIADILIENSSGGATPPAWQPQTIHIPDTAVQELLDHHPLVVKAKTMGLLHPAVARRMLEGKDADAIWQELFPENATLTYRRVLEIMKDLQEAQR